MAHDSLSLPNANSPRLLTRLLESVARGVRSSRGLQEGLGVELRTVQYYVRAGEWLGFLESGGETMLSPLGLEYVYDRPRRRVLYAEAVWSNGFVADLMAGRGGSLPNADDIAVAVAAVEPELAAATVRRRASAVRSLIAPAVQRGRPRERSRSEQLSLPLPASVRTPEPPRFSTSGRLEYDPDLYRYLLVSLLDHGELTLGQVRALLDRVGASAAPIGGFVDLALSRGDAHRVDERLVVSSEVDKLLAVAETTTSVILSDPGYRAWLADLAPAASGDRKAEIRRDQAAHHYRRWDLRLFGRSAEAGTLRADLVRVLLGRSLDSYPVRSPAPQVVPVREPFLEVWEREGLLIALPPSLAEVGAGLGPLNESLYRARHAAHEVGLPSLTTRPVAVHGGLLHPGETLPRSVPDLRTLRQRLVLHAPYPSLVAAALLLHRSSPEAAAVVRHKGRWVLRHGRRRLGPLLAVLDEFAAARGWLVCRRRRGGLDARVLLGLLRDVGIITLTGRVAVLAEPLFARLRGDAEEMEVHEPLRALADALEAHLGRAEPVGAEE